MIHYNMFRPTLPSSGKWKNTEIFGGGGVNDKIQFYKNKLDVIFI
jgi:hypothetical protein